MFQIVHNVPKTVENLNFCRIISKERSYPKNVFAKNYATGQQRGILREEDSLGRKCRDNEIVSERKIKVVSLSKNQKVVKILYRK